MTIRTVIVCDRCANEIKSDDVVTLLRRALHPTHMADLCPRCFEAFNAFLLDMPHNQGTPRGFKRVDRLCPHFVPCVSPCSGYEIVPE